MSRFPELPIITPGPERKTTAEKYGGLFYLSVAGLVVCLGVLAIFGFGLWSMRTVWADIYLVNHVESPEIDRINAAWRLAKDPRVNDRQKWDLAISKIPPPLARYLLAESLTSAAPSAGPRAYAHSVSRSTGLPRFLPILFARPLAYAAAGGHPLDRESLQEIAENPNPDVGIWAVFALVVDQPESDGASRLAQPNELARKLRSAAMAHPPTRQQLLDEATLWMRTNQPDCNKVWNGWKATPEGIVRDAD